LYGAGLDRMTADGRFVHLRHVEGDPDSLASDNVLSLRAEDDGRVWIGTTAGLDVREADGRLRHVRFEGLARAPRIWRIDGDATGLRVATSAGLFEVGTDLVARRMGTGFLPERSVMSSARGIDGSLWVGGLDGLYWIGEGGRHRYFPPQRLLPGGQPGHLIWQVLRDHEGGLWLATQDGGIGYLSPDWRDFTRFSHVPDDPDSLARSRISALAADAGGHLLVGGQGGQLDRLDAGSGEVRHLAGRLGLASRSITALASTDDGRLWVGLHDGLCLVDGDNVRCVDETLLAGGIRWMAADAAGRAYVSPPGAGVSRVDPVTLAVTAMGLAQPNDADRETSQLLRHGNVLWRGSRAGLSRLDADGTQFVDVAGVAHGPVSAFSVTGTDLWVARPEALEHYRLEHGAAHLQARVDAAHHWPGVVAKAVAVDAHGRVWMPSEVGLWRYDPRDGRFRQFGAADGLPSAEFTSDNLVRLADGTVYAGTLGGVVGEAQRIKQDRKRGEEGEICAMCVLLGGRGKKK
jgi:ligand-binding sensor domain-containing protein